MLPKLITPLIAEINKQIGTLTAETQALLKVREDLQNICTHKFYPEGSDHNYTYEKCTICQLSRKL